MATIGDESIVSWQPHGKAFRVHQPDVFARTVMTRYFKQQTKYKSFQRQLHMYGFRRIRTGMDTGSYYHSMFIRDKKSISLRMSCEKVKGNKKSGKASGHRTADDPDFYSPEFILANNLTHLPQAGDPIQLATGISYHHTDVEKELPISTAQLFNQQVAVKQVTGGPSPSHQLFDEDPLSPCHVKAKV